MNRIIAYKSHRVIVALITAKHCSSFLGIPMTWNHLECFCFSSPHFGWFLWPFVKRVFLCWAVEQFFCCLHFFDYLFVSTGVFIVWPFFSRWKLPTNVGNSEFLPYQVSFTSHCYTFYGVVLF